MPGRADAPALLGGNGKDQVHLLVVATGERGLAGGFNSSIARLARDTATGCSAEGKTVKILTVGRKGNDILKRAFAEQYRRDDHRSAKCASIGYVNAQTVGEKILEMYEAGEFDVATLFYARFRSVISQVPTAQQLIPAKFERPRRIEAGVGHLRLRAGRGSNPQRTAAAQYLGAGVPGAAREQRVVLRRADERDGQRDAQCR